MALTNDLKLRYGQDVPPYQNEVSVLNASKVTARTDTYTHIRYENITSTTYAGGN